MLLISHRGNINGFCAETENHPSYIQTALDAGYDCEIDLWRTYEGLWLGHDKPTFKIKIDWLLERKWNLWVHCKNISALEEMSRHYLNYFWHESDLYTMTSKGWVWAYPNQPTSRILNKTITVLPEWNNTDVSEFAGVCSDFIEQYK
jgi:hypothetical protein